METQNAFEKSWGVGEVEMKVPKSPWMRVMFGRRWMFDISPVSGRLWLVRVGDIGALRAMCVVFIEEAMVLKKSCFWMVESVCRSSVHGGLPSASAGVRSIGS